MGGVMAYQDTWIRGHVTAQGKRSCADRYEVVRDVVGRYARPITVWDLGADLGYFGCRLAEEFGATSIMVEAKPGLVEVCRANGLPTTIVLTRAITGAELSDLATCEHADVVLALSVLHRVPDWRAMLAAAVALGETLIIETPARDELTAVHFPIVGALTDAIEATGARVIGTTAIPQSSTIRRPVYLLERKKRSLSRACCHLERIRSPRGMLPPRPHTITSTYQTKTITFDGGESREWIHGMNLWNWSVMGGSYPDKRTVKAAVSRAAHTLSAPHGDFKPWNLILQGATVQPIDFGHRRSADDVDAALITAGLVDDPTRAYVR